MKLKLSWLLALSLGSSIVATLACGSRLDVGDNTSDAGAGGVGAARVPDATTSPDAGDASTAASLVPCASGLLCWSDGQLTGETFTTVMPFADNDVWVATKSGVFAHWNGVALTSSYEVPGAPLTDVYLWGTDAAHLFAFVQRGPSGTPSEVLRWNGTTWAKDPRSQTLELAVLRKGAINTPSPMDASIVAVLAHANGQIELVDNTLTRKISLPSISLEPGETVADASLQAVEALASAWILTSKGRAFQWRSDGGNVWSSAAQLGDGQMNGIAIWHGGSPNGQASAVLDPIAGAAAVRRQIFTFDGGAWTLSSTRPYLDPSGAFFWTANPPHHGNATLFGSNGVPMIVAGTRAHSMGFTSYSGIDTYRNQTWTTDTSAIPDRANTFATLGNTIFSAGTAGSLYINRGGPYGAVLLSGWERLSGRLTYAPAAISTASDTNVWVAHVERTESGQSPSGAGSFLRHFDGSRWETLPLNGIDGAPAASSYGTTGGDSSFIKAIGKNDVWVAVGDKATGKRQIVHHSAARGWRTFDVPTGTEPTSIAATDPDNVWVSLRGASSGGLLHWDGRTMTAANAPVKNIHRMAASGNNMWFYEMSEGSLRVAHRDANGDRMVSCPTYLGDATIFAVGDEAWIGAANRLAHIVNDVCTVFDVNGSGWVGQGTGLVPNDVWFVGDTDNASEHMLHWDGQHFANIPASATVRLYSASMSSSGTLWVGGDHGAVLASRVPQGSTEPPH